VKLVLVSAPSPRDSRVSGFTRFTYPNSGGTVPTGRWTRDGVYTRGPASVKARKLSYSNEFRQASAFVSATARFALAWNLAILSRDRSNL